ncbi:hypothetical protein GUJ93_ZPchr0005g15755 [Zizania palustris]|uniref:Uncharacterized protein n=1 Tax=Zizania palustris TaxID=103762 RepID=A0A8J5SUZ2_ZIZPA|nr:hypothetical protein GUJ93_ZPchr0005g15755 [Zizania palustris]
MHKETGQLLMDACFTSFFNSEQARQLQALVSLQRARTCRMSSSQMATHRHTAKEIALPADSSERRSTFHWETLPHGADWVHAKRLRLMSSLHMVNVRSSTEGNKVKCEPSLSLYLIIEKNATMWTYLMSETVCQYLPWWIGAKLGCQGEFLCSVLDSRVSTKIDFGVGKQETMQKMT